MKSIKVSGIEPFNREIVGDDEFLPASISHQPPPPPSSQTIIEVEPVAIAITLINHHHLHLPKQLR